MTQAIILAGGFGTRLKSIIKNVPKPMAPIQGKPFLSYLLEDIYRQNVIKEVIFSLHYKSEKISQYFGNSYQGLPLKYVIEETPLGTGGAIKNCAPLLHPNSTFFVLNGDSFLQFSHENMLHCHIENARFITLALKKMPSCHRYGRVLLNESNCVVSFDASGDVGEGMINAGVYLCHSKLLEDLPPHAFSFEKDFLQKHVHFLAPNAFFSMGSFIDIGIPEDYMRANQNKGIFL